MDASKRSAALEGTGLEPDPVIEAYKQGVDRTLLRERLRRSVEERLRDLMSVQAFARELRQAGRRSFG